MEGRPRTAELRAGARPERIPLSAAQHRLWSLDRFGPEWPGAFPALVTELTGEPDVAALAAALEDLPARQEVLRTVYRETGGEPHQIVLAEAGPVLSTQQVTAAELDAGIAEFRRTRFDLATEIPIRARLFTLDPGWHVLTVVCHPIAVDTPSIHRITADLAVAYRARLAGSPPQWTPLPVQYADYALWRRKLPGQLSAPGPHPLRASRRGPEVGFDVPAVLRKEIVALAARAGTTTLAVLQGATAVLFSALGEEQDLAVGTIANERTDPVLNELAGAFATTHVTRIDLSGNPAFTELLARMRTDPPAVPRVPPAHPGEPPCPVLVTLTSTAAPVVELTGLHCQTHPLGSGPSEAALSFAFTERGERFAGALRCGTDRYDRASAGRLVQRLVSVLATLVRDPHQRVGAVDVLAPAERHRILREWSGSDTVVPASPSTAATTATTMFEATAGLFPHQEAVRFAGAALGYRELGRRANRLARDLLDAGVTVESVVALALPPSTELVVAVLAVLKAGAAVLPLDPDRPAARTAELLADVHPVALLTTAAIAPSLPRAGVVLDDPVVAARIATRPDHDVTPDERSHPLTGDNAACVLPGSGSADVSGPIVVRHHGVHAMATEAVTRLKIHTHTRMFQCAPPGTTRWVFEVFAALLNGATLVIAGDQPDASWPAGSLRREEVNLAVLPPAALQAAGRGSGWPAGLTLLSPGQGVPALAQPRVHPCHFEAATTTCATIGGRPVGTTVVRVLDRYLRPVAPGVPGELYLGGEQLARGYLGAPGRTAARFVADPFGDPGERLYRTGHRARWRPDGRLDDLGHAEFDRSPEPAVPTQQAGRRVDLGLGSDLAKEPVR